MSNKERLIEKLADLKKLNEDIRQADKEDEEEIAKEFRRIRRKKIKDINKDIDEAE